MSCLSCLKKVTTGTIGITKVALGVGMSPNPTIQSRRAICSVCEFRDKKPFIGSTCMICGCIVTFKTQLANEKCPKGKW